MNYHPPDNMTRIIAGSFAGKQLHIPQIGTRPTTDRVREAIFSSLESRRDLHELYCIDLYAGSGALGFEALSRGVEVGYFIDSDPAAIRVLKRNAQILKLEPIIHQISVETYLRNTQSHPQFDLVFCDPPYAMPNNQIEEILHTLTIYWLHTGAYIILERAKRSPAPLLPDNLIEIYRKNYGDTSIYLLEYSPPSFPIEA